MEHFDKDSLVTERDKTEYISPVSLWVVVRKRFLESGVFIEPAWTGPGDPAESGPVVFVSRMLAEVYARMRNEYHHVDDSNTWKAIALRDFDLLGHLRALGGNLNCMMTMGFSMLLDGSLLVAAGAPRIRYVPLSFEIPAVQAGVTFSFNRWVFDFIDQEWTSLGATDFVNDLEFADELDEKEFQLAARIAIASVTVSRDSSAETALWGVYSLRKEAWLRGDKSARTDMTLH